MEIVKESCERERLCKLFIESLHCLQDGDAQQIVRGYIDGAVNTSAIKLVGGDFWISIKDLVDSKNQYHFILYSKKSWINCATVEITANIDLANNKTNGAFVRTGNNDYLYCHKGNIKNTHQHLNYNEYDKFDIINVNNKKYKVITSMKVSSSGKMEINVGTMNDFVKKSFMIKEGS